MPRLDLHSWDVLQRHRGSEFLFEKDIGLTPPGKKPIRIPVAGRLEESGRLLLKDSSPSFVRSNWISPFLLSIADLKDLMSSSI
ncbi:hypothetical protein AX14_008317 [Amanita brunnescens Koide BX004]|nr:hypothetical protein AX14_008317 [Amanita brunnescens Koide BX004]